MKNYFPYTIIGNFGENTDDKDVFKFLKYFTEIDIDKINNIDKNININKLKILLANEATKLLHGKASASKAEKTAKEVFELGKISKTCQQKKFQKMICSKV